MHSIHREYAGATVAITGATGFVGTHLARRLVQCGARVRVLVRDEARLDPVLARACTVVQGDLLEMAALRELVGPAQWVFHCAANVATWGRESDYLRVNVQGVQKLFDALRDAPVAKRRLVHLSTVDVYGFPELAADEEMKLEPVAFHYGESKRQGDVLVRRLSAEHGLPCTVLRPCNVVGPGSPFVLRIGAALRSGLMLSVDGGRHHAGLVDIENLVDVILWSGLAPVACGQVYNVRDPWSVSWAQFVADLRRGTGLGGRVLNMDYRLAKPLAALVAAPWHWLGLAAEPPLHPLIVEIFGRTCGHSIAKLQAHGAVLGQVDYASSIRASLRWLAAQTGSKRH